MFTTFAKQYTHTIFCMKAMKRLLPLLVFVSACSLVAQGQRVYDDLWRMEKRGTTIDLNTTRHKA